MVWGLLPKHQAEGSNKNAFMVIFTQFRGQ